MCMLCVIPPNVIPSRDKMMASAINNPHGYGFAIVVPEENRIICERSMDADTSVNRFLELREQYKSGYAMWHARFATSGEQTVDNCHPFALPDKKHPNTTYVAHNGVLDVIEPKGEKRSDTRIFVEDLLPAIGGVKALDNDQVWNLINEFTRGSKVCVLTVHPEAEYQMYLFHEDAGWKDDDGVWWSNKSCEWSYSWYSKGSAYDYYYDDIAYAHTYEGAYKPKAKANPNPKSKDYDPLYDMYECYTCGSFIDIDLVEDDFCPTCLICFMCEAHKEACMCYKPERHKRDTEIVNAIPQDKSYADLNDTEKGSVNRLAQLRTYMKPEGGWILR